MILEIHPDPDNALSDGRQSLDLKEFGELMRSLRRVAEAVDRRIAVAEQAQLAESVPA